MANPCSQVQLVGDSSCAAQSLLLDVTTGNLSITDGNVVNLCPIVKLCETKTVLSDLTLIGTVLQLQYIGEDGVTQSKNADLAGLFTTAEIPIEDSNSIELAYVGGNLRADLVVDPAGTLPVSGSPNGVKFDCCPQTPITANTTNTITLLANGTVSHTLTANLKFQNSLSIGLSSSSSGLAATLLLSTNPANTATFGSDGALYVASVGSQLSGFALNGYVTTGPAGTLLVGADSKLYRIPTSSGETVITGINTNSVSLTVSGINSHSIQADVNIVNSNSVNLTNTVSGVKADLKIDNTTTGNVALSINSNGLKGDINCASVKGLMTTVATVPIPITKIYGQASDNTCGYATLSATQYGIKPTSLTTTQRLAIPNADLYDAMIIFDSTLRKYFWYDSLTVNWIQFA